jgi:hypothetical protein
VTRALILRQLPQFGFTPQQANDIAEAAEEETYNEHRDHGEYALNIYKYHTEAGLDKYVFKVFGTDGNVWLDQDGKRIHPSTDGDVWLNQNGKRINLNAVLREIDKRFYDR